jgi:HAD superfamily hydrolase (TIGR01509 family)
MIDLIIFDLDGVLADSEPIAFRVVAETVTAAGVPITTADMFHYVGSSPRDMYSDMERQSGVKLPPDIVPRVAAGILAAFRDELTPMPGVLEMLGNLDVRRAVASNGSLNRVLGAIDILGLTEYFAPHIYSADLVAAGKPEPDLFLHSASEMAVPPDRCLVIEDSLHGVHAALAAGMTVFGFTGASHFGPGHANALTAAGAQQVFSQMSELPAMLAAMMKAKPE